ncbi:MAG: deoxyribodipyrimidine photo-lyase [Bacteroidota bacterium]
MKPIIVWFRRDLRVNDHAALFHASRTGTPIIPLFIFDTPRIARIPSDGAVFDFQADCLNALGAGISSLGGSLIVRKGDALAVHEELIRSVQPAALYFNRDYAPAELDREQAVAALYRSYGIEVLPFKDHVLHEPEEILNGSGNPYVVFTPFANAWKKLPLMVPFGKPRPFSTPAMDRGPILLSSDLGRSRTISDPAFRGGEGNAKSAWRKFLADALPTYSKGRDVPALKGTSRMSAYLRFGAISARTLLEGLRPVLRDMNHPDLPSASKFIDELIWREFYQSVLYHSPRLAYESYRREFEDFPWKRDSRMLRAWKEGKTGFPLVDAGVRELNRTGWMHNRVRMVVASFLTKDLQHHWREGAQYFEEKLLDIETASNAGGWQWSAGAGVDPKPLRIFNPTLQAQRFDPYGKYIRNNVPELSRVPDRFIHTPHLMPPVLQKETKCIIGKDYSFPIVDHPAAAANFRASLTALNRGGKGQASKRPIDRG